MKQSKLKIEDFLDNQAQTDFKSLKELPLDQYQQKLHTRKLQPKRKSKHKLHYPK